MAKELPNRREKDPLPAYSRRRFLRTAAAAGAALAPTGLARGTQNLPPAVPEWMKVQGKPILSPAYGQPSPFEKGVIRRPTDLTPTSLSSWSFTPLQNLRGIVTPSGL